jgi:hypothetical protein
MVRHHTSFISTTFYGKIHTELNNVELFSASITQSERARVQLPMIRARDLGTVPGTKLRNSNEDPPFDREADRHIFPLRVEAMVVSESPLINGVTTPSISSIEPGGA